MEKEVRKPLSIRFATHQEWVDNRINYLGASEVATLFGYGYTTYYQLWHNKKGNLPSEDLSDVLPVIVGEEMEQGLGNIIRRVYEYDLRKSHRYLVHPNESLKLACSMDFEVRTGDAGWVPCELKIMDYGSFSDQFEETENAGEYDPPLKFALQLQTQLLITGKPYGYLIALVSNRQLVKIKMDADPQVHAKIKTAAEHFWLTIENDHAPAPDYDQDLQAMYYTMVHVDDGREVHHHGDAWWEDNIKAYAEASLREKGAKEIKSRIRAEVLDAIGPAIRVKCTSGSVVAKVTDRYGRPRRDLRITPRKGILI